MALVPSSSHPSGGSAPITQASYTGASVTIANGANAYLPFDLDSGTALLDLSVVTAPTVVTTGTYAALMQAAPDDLTAAGYIRVVLNFGDDIHVTKFAPGAAVPPSVELSATWYLTAASVISVRAYNFDGVSARDFSLNAFYLQRLA